MSPLIHYGLIVHHCVLQYSLKSYAIPGEWSTHLSSCSIVLGKKKVKWSIDFLWTLNILKQTESSCRKRIDKPFLSPTKWVSYKHKLIINQSPFLIVEANYIDQSMPNCLIADHLNLNPYNDSNVTLWANFIFIPRESKFPSFLIILLLLPQGK